MSSCPASPHPQGQKDDHDLERGGNRGRDGGPGLRSASVTATQDTFLFRIGKRAFNQLMADWPDEIAPEIIQVLTRRLRAMTEKEK